MENEATIEKLHGRIEALRATQIALLVALAAQGNLDLAGIARSASSWAKKSSVEGETLEALNAEMEILAALAEIPTR